jgi:ATP-dependent Clp protease ATP-binding subunit ClpA
MTQSPEIESIIEQAITYAKEHKHQYVTVEHLLLALVNYSTFKKCLATFGADVDTMSEEIKAYLESLHAIVSTQIIQEIFNKVALKW